MLKINLNADRTLCGFSAMIAEIKTGGSITPEEAATAVAEIQGALSGPFVVGLTGQAPIWLFGMLMHEAHASSAVLTFDPRLGWVVVQSHVSDLKAGEVYPD